MLTPFPAFVAPPSSSGSALTALRTAAPATTLTSRSRRAADGYGMAKGARHAWSALGGVSDGGAATSAGEEERTGIAAEPKLQPAVGEEMLKWNDRLNIVGGLATGATVVALAALGGFPGLAAAEAPAWVGPTKLVLDPTLLFFEFAFVARIVLSWYPKLDLNSAPQNLVAWPTEPILRPTRAIIPPAFGVDISPIVWVMICSLVHEILLGQQGILNLMSNK
ncbi:unnamed protein product [Ectocarpus sp. CCAP 1310/34]|nr:unnamed protein product [Ectocarpus sp. CCAP 1310/34]